jgi:hypothetical protein
MSEKLGRIQSFANPFIFMLKLEHNFGYILLVPLAEAEHTMPNVQYSTVQVHIERKM